VRSTIIAAIVAAGLLGACGAPPRAKLGSAPSAGPAAEAKIVELPGVTVNLMDRYAEMDGAVCLTEGLLELIATVPAGKEHESIVSLRTRPSNLHAALLMLGLKPGHPGRWVYHPDRVETVDPTGDRVRLALRWEQDGRWVEKPIHHFVLDREGKKRLPSDQFVFAGSQLVEPRSGEGGPVYLADQTGDIAALVSFNTEVLAWPTAASDSNESLYWMANPRTLPELGTPVKLRVYPVE